MLNWLLVDVGLVVPGTGAAPGMTGWWLVSRLLLVAAAALAFAAHGDMARAREATGPSDMAVVALLQPSSGRRLCEWRLWGASDAVVAKERLLLGSTLPNPMPPCPWFSCERRHRT